MQTDTSITPSTQDQAAEIGRTAVDCYFSAILLAGRLAAELCPHLGGPYQAGLVRLRQRLAFETTSTGLVESLEALETDLAASGRRAPR